MTVAKFDCRQLEPATFGPPLSKSDAQRALVLAHAWGRPQLADLDPWREAGLPDDVVIVEDGLKALRGYPDEVTIDCRDGGTPFRFLLTQAALTPGKRIRFVGSKRLGERPHQALIDALLESLGPFGLEIRDGKPWPLDVVGAEADDLLRFRVGSEESSQFASSMLLGAASLSAWTSHPVEVELVGEVASGTYLMLTLEWLRRMGFELKRTGNLYAVAPLSPPERTAPIPGDWSSLGYLLLLAWRTHGGVANADIESPHPDRIILQHLAQVGLKVSRRENLLRVDGSLARGLEADGAVSPDLLPTLAALACVAPARSVFRNVGILRAKESDRLEGIQALVGAAGGTTELDGETLTITPPAKLTRQLTLDSRGDHRMAMSAAILAVLTRAELTLKDPDCVSKSFPRFWDELAKTGVRRTAG